MPPAGFDPRRERRWIIRGRLDEVTADRLSAGQRPDHGRPFLASCRGRIIATDLEGPWIGPLVKIFHRKDGAGPFVPGEIAVSSAFLSHVGPDADKHLTLTWSGICDRGSTAVRSRDRVRVSAHTDQQYECRGRSADVIAVLLRPILRRKRASARRFRWMEEEAEGMRWWGKVGAGEVSR